MQILYPIEFRKSLEIRLDNSKLGPNHHDIWCDILDLKRLSHLDQLNLLIALGDFFTFMPFCSSEPKGEIKKEILKNPITQKVTFFGGTFFPFHQGHMACLKLCPEENIVVVPDCNPQKECLDESSDPFFQFIELCHQLKETPYSLYPGFIGRNRPNPTSRWLPHVNIAEKNFILGDDSFMQLFNWEKPDLFLNALTKLYIVPRIHAQNSYQNQIDKIKKIHPQLKIIILPEHPHMHLSSSQLRK